MQLLSSVPQLLLKPGESKDGTVKESLFELSMSVDREKVSAVVRDSEKDTSWEEGVLQSSIRIVGGRLKS